MKGKIVSFRRGRHTQYKNQMLVKPQDVHSRDEAEELMGKKVEVKLGKDSVLEGKITKPHGDKGVVRVLFEKGVPGQALGKEVKIT